MLTIKELLARLSAIPRHAQAGHQITKLLQIPLQEQFCGATGIQILPFVNHRDHLFEINIQNAIDSVLHDPSAFKRAPRRIIQNAVHLLPLFSHEHQADRKKSFHRLLSDAIRETSIDELVSLLANPSMCWLNRSISYRLKRTTLTAPQLLSCIIALHHGADWLNLAMNDLVYYWNVAVPTETDFRNLASMLGKDHKNDEFLQMFCTNVLVHSEVLFSSSSKASMTGANSINASSSVDYSLDRLCFALASIMTFADYRRVPFFSGRILEACHANLNSAYPADFLSALTSPVFRHHVADFAVSFANPILNSQRSVVFRFLMASGSFPSLVPPFFLEACRQKLSFHQFTAWMKETLQREEDVRRNGTSRQITDAILVKFVDVFAEAVQNTRRVWVPEYFHAISSILHALERQSIDNSSIEKERCPAQCYVLDVLFKILKRVRSAIVKGDRFTHLSWKLLWLMDVVHQEQSMGKLDPSLDPFSSTNYFEQRVKMQRNTREEGEEKVVEEKEAGTELSSSSMEELASTTEDSWLPPNQPAKFADSNGKMKYMWQQHSNEVQEEEDAEAMTAPSLGENYAEAKTINSLIATDLRPFLSKWLAKTIIRRLESSQTNRATLFTWPFPLAVSIVKRLSLILNQETPYWLLSDIISFAYQVEDGIEVSTLRNIFDAILSRGEWSVELIEPLVEYAANNFSISTSGTLYEHILRQSSLPDFYLHRWSVAPIVSKVIGEVDQLIQQEAHFLSARDRHLLKAVLNAARSDFHGEEIRSLIEHFFEYQHDNLINIGMESARDFPIHQLIQEALKQSYLKCRSEECNFRDLNHFANLLIRVDYKLSSLTEFVTKWIERVGTEQALKEMLQSSVRAASLLRKCEDDHFPISPSFVQEFVRRILQLNPKKLSTGYGVKLILHLSHFHSVDAKILENILERVFLHRHEQQGKKSSEGHHKKSEGNEENLETSIFALLKFFESKTEVAKSSDVFCAILVQYFPVVMYVSVSTEGLSAYVRCAVGHEKFPKDKKQQLCECLAHQLELHLKEDLGPRACKRLCEIAACVDSVTGGPLLERLYPLGGS